MQANEKASRRIIEEVFGAGKYDIVGELVDDKAIGHDPARPEPTVGIDGLKESARGYRAAFPDLTCKVEQSLASGDLVALQWSARGTHKGELSGSRRPASRRRSLG